MPHILAIISKAVFEADAKSAKVGDILPIDRYTSANKGLEPLREGGRLFLVTVRPPDEALWLVAVLENPRFEDGAWRGSPNRVPIADLGPVRDRIRFASGTGISPKKGALGMSLQTPRALTNEDVALILSEEKSEPLAELPYDDLQLPAWLAHEPARREALAKQIAAAHGLELVGITELEGHPIATLRHPSGALLQLIPGGRFEMGFAPHEQKRLQDELEDIEFAVDAKAMLEDVSTCQPVHAVDVAPFLLAKECVDYGDVRGDRVDEVTASLLQEGLRLPSEAEWEWAARGGFSSLFAHGDDIPDEPQWADNGFGLNGMGELTEVCADGFHPSYDGAPTTSVPWPGNDHVARGGASNLYPWQTNSEWMLMLAGARTHLGRDASLVSFRPAISLFGEVRPCALVSLRTRAKVKAKKIEASGTVGTVLHGLDAIEWASLRHAEGNAKKVPEWLAAVEKRGYIHPLDALAAPGKFFTATVAAVPFIVRLAQREDCAHTARLLYLLGDALLGDWDERIMHGVDLRDPTIKKTYAKDTAKALLAAANAEAGAIRSFLDHAESGVRAAAAYTLAFLFDSATENLSALRVRADRECDPFARASMILGATYAARYAGEDITAWLEATRASISPHFVRGCAALGLVMAHREKASESALAHCEAVLAMDHPARDAFAWAVLSPRQVEIGGVSLRAQVGAGFSEMVERALIATGPQGKTRATNALIEGIVRRTSASTEQLEYSDRFAVWLGAVLDLHFVRRDEPIPWARELQEEQRRVVAALSQIEVWPTKSGTQISPGASFLVYGLPPFARERARWLGLAEETALERASQIGDKARPLWCAIRAMRAEKKSWEEIFAALGYLDDLQRLIVAAEVSCNAYLLAGAYGEGIPEALMVDLVRAAGSRAHVFGLRFAAELEAMDMTKLPFRTAAVVLSALMVVAVYGADGGAFYYSKRLPALAWVDDQAVRAEVVAMFSESTRERFAKIRAEGFGDLKYLNQTALFHPLTASRLALNKFMTLDNNEDDISADHTEWAAALVRATGDAGRQLLANMRKRLDVLSAELERQP